MLPTEEVSVSVMLVVTLYYCGGWCVVCVCAAIVACAEAVGGVNDSKKTSMM